MSTPCPGGRVLYIEPPRYGRFFILTAVLSWVLAIPLWAMVLVEWLARQPGW